MPEPSFEEQVANALSCAEDFVDGTGAIWVKRDDIAPRVAAAIEAAANDPSLATALKALKGDA